MPHLFIVTPDGGASLHMHAALARQRRLGATATCSVVHIRKSSLARTQVMAFNCSSLSLIVCTV